MAFPTWWNRSGFFERFGAFSGPGSRWHDTGNPWYVDYVLLLSAGEAATWDQECRQNGAGDPRDLPAEVIEAMRQLEERLDASRWVVVESYEWESGLD